MNRRTFFNAAVKSLAVGLVLPFVKVPTQIGRRIRYCALTHKEDWVPLYDNESFLLNPEYPFIEITGPRNACKSWLINTNLTGSERKKQGLYYRK